jgi:hypothetical protein
MFGCPVYALQDQLQGGKAIPNWNKQAPPPQVQWPTILAGDHTSSFYELLELTPHPCDSAVMTDVSRKVLAANQVG